MGGRAGRRAGRQVGQGTATCKARTDKTERCTAPAQAVPGCRQCPTHQHTYPLTPIHSHVSTHQPPTCVVVKRTGALGGRGSQHDSGQPAPPFRPQGLRGAGGGGVGGKEAGQPGGWASNGCAGGCAAVGEQLRGRTWTSLPCSEGVKSAMVSSCEGGRGVVVGPRSRCPPAGLEGGRPGPGCCLVLRPPPVLPSAPSPS